MYIRARMDAYLDPTAGKLDSISAEPLRVWRITGTDDAIEKFRIAVNGTVISDEDVPNSPVSIVIQQVVEKQAKVDSLQASLDVATAELETVTAQMQQVEDVAPVIDAAPVVDEVVAIKST